MMWYNRHATEEDSKAGDKPAIITVGQGRRTFQKPFTISCRFSVQHVEVCLMFPEEKSSRKSTDVPIAAMVSRWVADYLPYSYVAILNE